MSHVELETIDQQRRSMKLEKEWLSRKEAAIYLTSIGCPIAAGTLRNLASNNNRGKGPPFTRSRWKSVRYARLDLDQWAAKHRERID